MKSVLPLTHPLHLVMGLIIWSLWLISIYAGLSLGCIVSSAPGTLGPWSWINIALLVFTFLITVMLLWLAVRCWRYPIPEDDSKQNRFNLRVSAAIYLASAVATVAAVYPMMRLPPCL